MRWLAAALLVTSLLGGCSKKTAPSEPASGVEDPVSWTKPVTRDAIKEREGETTLSFAWPVGTKARVVAVRSVARDGKDVLSGEVRWSFELRAFEGGRVRVEATDLEFDRIAAVEPQDKLNASLVDQMFMPSFELQSDGKLAGLVDEKAASETIKAAFEKALPSSDPEIATLKRFLGRRHDPDVVSRTVKELWRSLVEALNGRKLTLGAEFASKGDAMFPMSGAREEIQSKGIAVGRAPCFVGDAASRCVWINVVTDSMAKQVQDEIEKDPALVRGEGVDLVDLTYSVTLLTEVETLLPHQWTIEKRSTTKLEDREMKEVERRRWILAYDPASIRSAQ